MTASGVVTLAILGTLIGPPDGRAQDATTTAESGLTQSGLLREPTKVFVQDEFGAGFRPGAQAYGFNLGAGAGVQVLGGKQRHDLAWGGISYGRMIGDLKGEGHWYRGNFELRAEFLAGAEFSPDTEWLVALTPHLRYNFATGTRWVPFFDLGAGVSATGIGPPDLSHTFEFNLQAAVGTHYFLSKGMAITTDARYLHMSCAGINHPNLGLNTVMGTLGLTWLF